MKIQAEEFVEKLKFNGLSPFLMVPCSIFKSLSWWMLKNEVEVIFPPNEAHAMGFAVGSYSVTGEPAVIFMQNSGLGNITNAQTSLHALYKIPVLLVVSWRGERPETPEHQIMGKNLKKFFKVLQIPFEILGQDWRRQLKKMAKLVISKQMPAAVVIRKGFFVEESYSIDDLVSKYSLSRFKAIKIIKEALKSEAVFISTNGHPSRDSFAVAPTPDFYMMGSMGHAFSVGAGTAWSLSQKDSNLRTVVLDGDGGCLMHLGSLVLVNLKKIKQSNLVYVVLDNEAYESTGSQPTFSPAIDFAKIARGLGFPQTFSVTDERGLKKAIDSLKPNLVSFIHIKVNRKKVETPRVSDKYSCGQISQRFRRNFQ